MEIKQGTTCAVLYRVDGQFLICHSTGGPYWGLPKGMRDEADPNEAFAASRELWEETGITVSPEKLHYVGNYNYKRDKNLSLFEYTTAVRIATADMYCRSTFIGKNGKKYPEVDYYRYIDIDNAHKYLNSNMLRILRRAVKWQQ